jgi:hypothetical protein
MKILSQFNGTYYDLTKQIRCHGTRVRAGSPNKKDLFNKNIKIKTFTGFGLSSYPA